MRDRDITRDWYNAFINVEYRFEALADGANIANNAQTAPVNGSFSLIKQMTLKSAGKTVYEADDIAKIIFIKNILAIISKAERGDDLLMATTQINRMKKSASEKRGDDLRLSQTQIAEIAQQLHSNLFSAALSLARPLLAPAAKALANAGLSFAAERALKKIFAKGFGLQEVQLFKLTQLLSPDQKKAVEKMLVGKGMVRGGGTAQYGGFLGMLSSIGVPLANELVKKVIGKGMHGRTRRLAPAPRLHPLLLHREVECSSTLPGFHHLSGAAGRITNKKNEIQGRTAVQH